MAVVARGSRCWIGTAPVSDAANHFMSTHVPPFSVRARGLLPRGRVPD
jgi:hypothetical protein